jgi:hypothetical protein
MRRLNLPLALIISACIIAAMAAFHLYAGRSLICKCGFVKLFWWGPKAAPQESQHLIDIYSASHILHGIIFYFLTTLIAQGRLSVGARLVIAVFLEAGWELWENSNYLVNRYRDAGVDYSGDSVINSMTDVVAMIVGFLMAARFPAWVSVLILIATELIMLALIRDNLFLNILNLIRPIEWITEWQEGG